MAVRSHASKRSQIPCPAADETSRMNQTLPICEPLASWLAQSAFDSYTVANGIRVFSHVIA